MGQGRERNRLCWCRSGKKFKHCHFDRESAPAFSPKDLVEIRKRLGVRRICLHPLASENECSPQHASAHSVSLRYLERIALAQHVYTYENDITRNVFTSLQVRPRKIGVRDASAFQGFCARHDNELFRRIDQEDPRLDLQSSFLLSYRAFAREVYFKQEQLRMIPFHRQLDGGMSHDKQVRHQRDIDELESVVRFGLTEMEAGKRRYDNMFRSGDYSKFGCYSFVTREAPHVCCSGAAPMVASLMGDTLARPEDVESYLEEVALTILPLEAGGLVSFGWLEPSMFGAMFLDAVRSAPACEIADRTLTFMFGNLENVFMGIPWWDQLDDHTKERIMEISGFLFGSDPQRLRELMKNPVRGLGSWTIADSI
jgi:hypothetical protein